MGNSSSYVMLSLSAIVWRDMVILVDLDPSVTQSQRTLSRTRKVTPLTRGIKQEVDGSMGWRIWQYSTAKESTWKLFCRWNKNFTPHLSQVAFHPTCLCPAHSNSPVVLLCYTIKREAFLNQVFSHLQTSSTWTECSLTYRICIRQNQI